jgi:hypothetical protein
LEHANALLEKTYAGCVVALRKKGEIYEGGKVIQIFLGLNGAPGGVFSGPVSLGYTVLDCKRRYLLRPRIC